MSQFSSQFTDCPRCGYHTYECLRSHAFCLECGFSDVTEEQARNLIPRWAQRLARAIEAEETPELDLVPAAG